MRRRDMHRIALLLAALVAALMLSGAATAASVTTVMTGLDNPRGLAFSPEGTLYVTEGGRGGSGPPCRTVRGMPQCYGPTGAISRLRRGVQEKWLTGLPSLAPASGLEAETGPQDIAFQGGVAFVTMGFGGTPAERALLGPQFALSGKLLQVGASGEIKEIADLSSHEAAANPDGGEIFSNPFGVLALPDRQIVADAGANAVLTVAANGAVSTLAAFASRQNPTPIGRPVVDSVPTAIALGPDGALYVSELTGVPFLTGFARIHRIAPDEARSVYATGLTAVVDLAFGDDGSLYALQHASCGPFFACPGSIVRVGASAPHAVVYAGLSRPSAFTIGPEGSRARRSRAGRSLTHGAFYVSNQGSSAAVGEVLRIEP